jgi:BlaI family transcriptional regulator, penicillinase repressor
MAKPKPHQQLSRRERQIMDALYRLKRAPANGIQAAMPDPPSYSAVRAHLRTLEDKGHVRHESEDLRYVYVPTQRPDLARRTALTHVVDTFFEGSVAQAASALLDSRSARISPDDLDRLAGLIERARQEGR